MTYYNTPPGDILPDTAATTAANDTSKQANAIINTFAALGVGLSLVEAVTAPQLAAFHLKLKDLKDYPKIKRLLPTVAAAIRSPIVQSVSSVASVCLTIPRLTRQIIALKSVINSPEFIADTSILPAAVGVSSDNKVITLDIAKMPHILIAGTTGSGKSIAVNTMLCSLLFKASPNKCRLLMIDPKRVEFAPYKDLPHLLHPIATTTAVALHILKELCRIMDNRYKELEQDGKKHIDQTDKPHIVLAVDELADLLLTSDGEAENYLIRLAQLGRAAGVHLIVATQRPTRAVIPGLLSANIPCKIALKVSSIRESVVILDHKGAEALTGCGDALIKIPDKVAEIRTQTAYTSTADVQNLVEWWKSKGITNE